MKGRVFKSTGSWYSVKVGDTFYNCRLRGKMRLYDEKVTNPVAVGDWVEIQLENDEEGIIQEVVERTNYVIRNLQGRSDIVTF